MKAANNTTFAMFATYSFLSESMDAFERKS
jgi:hypothetical protein